MKTLQPLILPAAYVELIEKVINDIFATAIYRPLAKLLKVNLELQNAVGDPLAAAVAAGRIEYDGGIFSGSFNAATSKRLKQIGGVFDRRSGTWMVPKANVPASVSLAAAQADARYKAISDGIIKVLDGIDIDKSLRDSGLKGGFYQTVTGMNDDFLETVRGVAIAPELTPKVREIVAEEWSNNMSLYVKDWAEQNIMAMREKVRANAFVGQRAQNLVNTIRDNYGVSTRKAKFLARQETSLLMSKLREQRYKEIGLHKYKWSTSHDERVRERHKHLNGKVFDWSTPPIVDDKGNRAHPGEDFNCRCIAIPIMDEK